jgi:hypothetical protein
VLLLALQLHRDGGRVEFARQHLMQAYGIRFGRRLSASDNIRDLHSGLGAERASLLEAGARCCGAQRTGHG